MIEKKKSITVYHVHFPKNEYNKGMELRDYYFGSISAIYEVFDKSKIGIVASSLYNLNMDEVLNPVYENKRCRIRKSILLTKGKTK